MKSFVEKTYKENGIQVQKLKTVGYPLRLRAGSWGFLDIFEIPTENLGKSWRDINRQSKKRTAPVKPAPNKTKT